MAYTFIFLVMVDTLRSDLRWNQSKARGRRHLRRGRRHLAARRAPHRFAGENANSRGNRVAALAVGFSFLALLLHGILLRRQFGSQLVSVSVGALRARRTCLSDNAHHGLFLGRLTLQLKLLCRCCRLVVAFPPSLGCPAGIPRCAASLCHSFAEVICATCMAPQYTLSGEHSRGKLDFFIAPLFWGILLLVWPCPTASLFFLARFAFGCRADGVRMNLRGALPQNAPLVVAGLFPFFTPLKKRALATR